jgi:hypothetical protein
MPNPVNVYSLSVTSANCAATNGVYFLKITGSSASGLNVKYATSSQGPWDNTWSGTGTYRPAGTNPGTPNNPSAGDVLTLTGNFPLSTSPCSLSGDRVYVATGTNPGFTGLTAAAGDGDWAASSN